MVILHSGPGASAPGMSVRVLFLSTSSLSLGADRLVVRAAFFHEVAVLPPEQVCTCRRSLKAACSRKVIQLLWDWFVRMFRVIVDAQSAEGGFNRLCLFEEMHTTLVNVPEFVIAHVYGISRVTAHSFLSSS